MQFAILAGPLLGRMLKSAYRSERSDEMNIGDVARSSGVSAKMIRHYEAIGLLPPAPRTETGYRRYDDSDTETLRFIRAARDLGFSLERIGSLLSLWQKSDRSSREVKALAQEHITDMEAKVEELNRMIAALKLLAEHCQGDHRPECPILDSLGRMPGGTSPTTRSKRDLRR